MISSITSIPNKHCINTKQFDLTFLYRLCELTDKIRLMCETDEGSDYIASLLRNKRAILYFKQPSTRTFLSFQNACHILGIKSSEIRDTSTSSEMKGETEEDSVKTFSQYADLIIMRHSSTDFIYEISSKIGNNKIIINAGSGTDQHPTQALLDFYTIYKCGLKSKKIAFIGDLKRGRTVRSLSLLLNNIKDIKLYFVAPKSFQIKEDILNELTIDYEITDNLDEVLSKADVIYMTRLQDEYGGVEEKFDRRKYTIDERNLALIKKDAIIMHPLPRRDEISVVVDKDKRAKYWDQVKNGMWVRAALILMLFDKDEEVLSSK